MKMIKTDRKSTFTPINVTIAIESQEEMDNLVKMANNFIATEIRHGGYSEEEKEAVEKLVETVGFALQEC